MSAKKARIIAHQAGREDAGCRRPDRASGGGAGPRAIVQQLYPGVNELQVMALEPGLERILLQVQAKTGDAGIEPGLVDTLLREAGAAAAAGNGSGCRRCCWCRPNCACCSPAAPRRVADQGRRAQRSSGYQHHQGHSAARG